MPSGIGWPKRCKRPAPACRSGRQPRRRPGRPSTSYPGNGLSSAPVKRPEWSGAGNRRRRAAGVPLHHNPGRTARHAAHRVEPPRRFRRIRVSAARIGGGRAALGGVDLAQRSPGRVAQPAGRLPAGARWETPRMAQRGLDRLGHPAGRQPPVGLPRQGVPGGLVQHGRLHANPAAVLWAMIENDFPRSGNRLLDAVDFDWLEADHGWLAETGPPVLERKLLDRLAGELGPAEPGIGPPERGAGPLGCDDSRRPLAGPLRHGGRVAP